MEDGVGILLVDESPQKRVRLRRELAAVGLAVTGEAGSSQEAFSVARQVHPDAALVSLTEPMARGLRMIEMLAAALPEVPLIATSADAGRETMRKAVLAGARAVVSSPLRSDELTETLTALQKHRSRSAPSQVTGTIISIFGPKGGIGKTTVAVNLGTCIAMAKQDRPVLLDLDHQTGASAVMLDLSPQRSSRDLLEHSGHVDQDLLANFVVGHASGLGLLAAPVWSEEEGDWEPEPVEVDQLLSALASHYDYVIVDTPPMLTRGTLRAVELSTYALLVTSLEVSSLQACRRVLDRVGPWEFSRDKVKVVTNVPNAANGLSTRDIESVLEYPVFWSIPHDPAVAASGQAGKPVVHSAPRSRAARALIDLHYTITGARPGNGSTHWPGILPSLKMGVRGA